MSDEGGSGGREGIPTTRIERVSVEKSTNNKNNTMVSSQRSLGGSSLPAPETTRPRQLSSRSLISNSSLRSLTSMGSTSVIGETATATETDEDLDETRRIAEELQEEEMLRLAMEQSLSESGFHNILQTEAFSPMRKSNRSITSVRSAPDNPNSPGIPQSLVQSFRIHPSSTRPRRRPAPQTTPLQPDYEDDMFDLSPRDEEEEPPTQSRLPGAISMPTPPPDLRLLEDDVRKSTSVRAAIASFVERGMELPLSGSVAGDAAQQQQQQPTTTSTPCQTSGMREPAIVQSAGRRGGGSGGQRTAITATTTSTTTTSPRTPDRRREFAERDGLEKHASLRRAQEMIARCEAAAGGPLGPSATSSERSLELRRDQCGTTTTGRGSSASASGNTSERSLEAARRDERVAQYAAAGEQRPLSERSLEAANHHRGSRPHQEIMAMMAATTGRSETVGMPLQLRSQYAADQTFEGTPRREQQQPMRQREFIMRSETGGGLRSQFAAEKGIPPTERSFEATSRREQRSGRRQQEISVHPEKTDTPIQVRNSRCTATGEHGRPSSSDRSSSNLSEHNQPLLSEQSSEAPAKPNPGGGKRHVFDQCRSWRPSRTTKQENANDGPIRNTPRRAISGSGFFRRGSSDRERNTASSDHRSVATRHVDDCATTPVAAATSPTKCLQKLGLDINKLKVDSQTSPVVVSDARLGRKSAWKRLESSANPSASAWPTLGEQPPLSGTATASVAEPEPSYDLAGAEEHLSPEELQQIQMALQESSPVAGDTSCRHDKTSNVGSKRADAYDGIEDMDMMGALTDDEEDFGEPMPPSTIMPPGNNATPTPEVPLSEEDSAAIMQAVLQAEQESEQRRAEDEQKSLKAIALLMQEEGHVTNKPPTHQEQHGNVRTMTRAEYNAHQFAAHLRSNDTPGREEDSAYDDFVEEGYRMNSSAPQRWARRDQHSVIGPNREIRTKHDAVLNGQSNAHRLGLEENFASVSNKAFNSFKQSMKSSKKGVATAGSGRAGSDATGTRSGGLDDNVRGIISRAVNNGVIEKCNGVVNEGKEAVIFHADEGMESDGFDVAIKVFKRIQEFKNRGDYVEGDPRYSRSSFTNANRREQLELWAEKEFRNLMRAHNADVPVPAPLLIKENVVFMRFLGTGWPAPQLKDLDIPRGSKRWSALYDEIIDAVRRLYQTARLVHGDLSEYNVLVVPARYVQKTPENSENASDTELKVVLIDMAQAVDTRHPSAPTLLNRDLETLLSFFTRQGVTVPMLSAVVVYVQTCY